ncbi:MAG: archaeosortase/exosortase family protein [Candidatus Hodarchaeota archaeon]
MKEKKYNSIVLNIKDKIKSIKRDQAFIYSLILLLSIAVFISHRTMVDVVIGSAAFLSLILLSEKPLDYSVSRIERLVGCFMLVMGFVVLPYGTLEFLGFNQLSYAGLGFAEIGIAATGVVLVFYGLKGIRVYGVSLMFFFVYGLLTPLLTRIRYAVDYHFPWYNALIARVVGSLVWLGGIESEVHSNIIILNGKKGVLALEVGPICAGVDAMVIFGLLLVLLISHLRLPHHTKAVSSLLGIFGLIPLNLVRVSFLVIVGYLYGLDMAMFFHSHIGDILFLLYVVGFFILLSGLETSSVWEPEDQQKDPTDDY